jgi:2-dehydro-3-deoxygluconokinase
MTRFASIGECMIELAEHPDGRLTRSFGGDTLNTAVYMARLGADVEYVTALGEDPFSEEMLAAWRKEGVGVSLVARKPGRLPGLYIIQTDAKGERCFFHWRDRAPAREIFSGPDVDALVKELVEFDVLYFSGISLSLYGAKGRARLFSAADALRAKGGQVAFDTNFRPRGWPDREEARAAYGLAFACADMVLASVDDLTPLFGEGGAGQAEALAPRTEVVLKLEKPGCRILAGGEVIDVPAPPVAHVVDTTAAGDSFAAAYLVGRAKGLAPRQAALMGHRLAGAVVQHRGAIIPHAAMPAFS